MQAVAGIVKGQQPVGLIRIACDGIEVDDPIENAAGANPLIDGLALCLARWRMSLERQDRGTEYHDAALVRALGQLAQSVNQIFSAHDIDAVAADVVDA